MSLGGAGGRAAEPERVRHDAADPGGVRVYIDDPFVRDAVHRAVAHASERLAFPECRSLLDDLADEDGQALRGRLQAHRVEPQDYLRWLVFHDGSDHPTCREEGTLAFTAPGSRVVFLCGRAFSRAWYHSRGQARVVVIHELLHSLGLGENPPSSSAISALVDRRCWR